jgi:hypothetical protein
MGKIQAAELDRWGVGGGALGITLLKGDREYVLAGPSGRLFLLFFSMTQAETAAKQPNLGCAHPKTWRNIEIRLKIFFR